MNNVIKIVKNSNKTNPNFPSNFFNKNISTVRSKNRNMQQIKDHIFYPNTPILSFDDTSIQLSNDFSNYMNLFAVIFFLLMVCSIIFVLIYLRNR